MASAQERYAAMLRDEIAPALRTLGFKGSGTSYVLPDPRDWVVLGFQGSRWNSAQDVRFTVNLMVADKLAWESGRADRAWWPTRPKANVSYGPEVSAFRLGVISRGSDQWWVVSANAPTRSVADAVLDSIERSGMPWIRKRMRTRSG